MTPSRNFRKSGELSDLEVNVKDKQFKLHKFPLFSKSEYIRAQLAKNNLNSLDLSEIPGGPEAFSLVADYCYDEPIELTPETAADMQAASSFLEMNGKENLSQHCNDFIDHLIHEAKSFRKLLPFVQLLSRAAQSSDSPLYAKLFCVLKGLWIRNTACVHSPRSCSFPEEECCEDNLLTDFLVYLPSPVITQLITDIEQEVNVQKNQMLANAVVHYLGRFLDLDKLRKREPVEKKALETKKEANSSEEAAEEEKPVEEEQELSVVAKPVSMEQSYSGYSMIDPCQQTVMEDYVKKFDYSKRPAIEVFNELFAAISADIPLAEVAPKAWVKDAVLLVQREKEQATCKDKVLRLASSCLDKLTPEDLQDLSPETTVDILRLRQSTNEKGSDEDALAPQLVTTLDLYMSKCAGDKMMNAQDYIGLLKLTDPAKTRSNHDALVRPLISITDNGGEVTEAQKEELIQLIDLSKCSADRLQELLDKNLLPPRNIAEAAIKVAKQRGHRSSTPEAPKSVKWDDSPRSCTPSQFCCNERPTSGTGYSHISNGIYRSPTYKSPVYRHSRKY